MSSNSSWIDRLWDREPPVPVVGTRSGLTGAEKRILLAYAQGSETAQIAKQQYGVLPAAFERQALARLRIKLHANDLRRLVKLAYECGALELSGEPPEGVTVPEPYLSTLLLLADGYQNAEIAEKLGRAFGTVRTHVGFLATAFAVKRGLGGRAQLASRCFEFGIIPGAYVSLKPKAAKSA